MLVYLKSPRSATYFVVGLPETEKEERNVSEVISELRGVFEDGRANASHEIRK